MFISQPNRHLTVNLLSGKDPEKIYVCQIDDPLKVEEWVTSPDARNYQKEEASRCAMCCAKMILRAEDRREPWLKVDPSLEELFDWAQDCFTYRWEDGDDGWKGAYHGELAAFFWHSLRLWSQAERNVDLNFVRQRLLEGYYVLASVHPNIRFPNNDDVPEKKGGHFVLIYGFEIHGDTCWFFVMNSAGFASQNSQIAVKILSNRVYQLFSGNVVLVRSQRCVHKS